MGKKETGNDLFIGKTVYYKELHLRTGIDASLKEVKISKIGKKYFETDKTFLGRFSIDDLKHDGGKYSPRYQIYLDKEMHDNEQEANNIYSKLRNIFSSYSNPKIELSKLKQILEILENSGLNKNLK